MPYKDPKDRNYKRDYQTQLARGKDERENRLARARARYALDKKGVDRTGKDIAHVKALSKGGSNAPSNLKLQSPSANRSFARDSNHGVKSEVSKRERAKR